MQIERATTTHETPLSSHSTEILLLDRQTYLVPLDELLAVLQGLRDVHNAQLDGGRIIQGHRRITTTPRRWLTASGRGGSGGGGIRRRCISRRARAGQ